LHIRRMMRYKILRYTQNDSNIVILNEVKDLYVALLLLRNNPIFNRDEFHYLMHKSCR
jgi:hypothetical protein